MIAACLKWVDRRPAVDPLTGEVVHDPRSAGTSEADDAALEWALRLGDAWECPVLAVTAGPVEADAVLRAALAAGASRAVRIPCSPDAPSATVAAAIAGVLPADVDVTVCGNWSLDRGSGSVPAFLAARRAATQALGLVALSIGDASGRDLRGERRLDGGRRELLGIPRPAVVSVEGGSARLRRAALRDVIAARSAPIEVAPAVPAPRSDPGVHRRPFRPRPRSRPAPTAASARERILDLTGARTDPTPPQRLVLEPPEAAARIVAQLHTWGYLE
ncbi:MAG: hypothetical protein NVS1B12_05890 [Acidimicrobiales bacterium]